MSWKNQNCSSCEYLDNFECLYGPPNIVRNGVSEYPRVMRFWRVENDRDRYIAKPACSQWTLSANLKDIGLERPAKFDVVTGSGDKHRNYVFEPLSVRKDAK